MLINRNTVQPFHGIQSSFPSLKGVPPLVAFVQRSVDPNDATDCLSLFPHHACLSSLLPFLPRFRAHKQYGGFFSKLWMQHFKIQLAKSQRVIFCWYLIPRITTLPTHFEFGQNMLLCGVGPRKRSMKYSQGDGNRIVLGAGF